MPQLTKPGENLRIHQDNLLMMAATRLCLRMTIVKLEDGDL